MKRSDYVAMLDRIDTAGADSLVHWLSGPRAGDADPLPAGAELPGTPARGLGKTCRRTPEGDVFVETLVGRPRLFIVGAGHVGNAFAHIAVTLGFETVVIDERPDFANPERLPGVDHIICGPYVESLAALPEYANSYFVFVTPGHKSDLACAPIALRRPFQYLGMIGSRAKIVMVRGALREQGFSEEQLDRIHAPIGLSIGGRDPAEIAVSIAAEIIQVRSSLGNIAFDPAIADGLRDLGRTPDLPAVLATVVGHGGSVPRGTGTRMLLVDGQQIVGSIGGGKIENASIQRSRALLDAGEAFDVHDYDLSNREGAELGMTCGGRVRIMFEAM